MKTPSPAPLPLSDGSRVTDAVRVQILAVEHSNLLTTRIMAWNEAFSRASMFLTVLSAAMVALALVAQGTAFGQGFRLFALLVLPVVLLVGVGTYSRLVAININDFWLVVGMNRLRHAYLELAPELEPYFVTGHHDDIPGFEQTYTHSSKQFGPSRTLASTPVIIAAIDAVLAGVFVAVVAQMLGASVAVAILAGGIGGAVFLIVLLEPHARWFARQRRAYQPLFPS